MSAAPQTEVAPKRRGRPRKENKPSGLIEYRVWTDMKSRCSNPKATQYKWYGALGVTVCDRWRDSFAAFYEDVGPRPGLGYSIERRDVNGNYEPGNVYWATYKEQGRNKRNTIRVTIDDETRPLLDWADAFGLSPERAYLELIQRPRIDAARRANGRGRNNARLVVANGQALTISEWAERSGIQRGTIVHRLWAGWEPARAVTVRPEDGFEERERLRIVGRGPRPERRPYWATTIEIDGRSQPAGVWADENGILRVTVYARLRAGWDAVAAVTTPPQASYPRGRRRTPPA
jgi:hypothetical protein